MPTYQVLYDGLSGRSPVWVNGHSVDRLALTVRNCMSEEFAMPVYTLWGMLGLVLGPVVLNVLDGARTNSSVERSWLSCHSPDRVQRIATISLVSGAELAIVASRFEDSALLPVLCWFAQTGIVLTLIDLECRLLPRRAVGAMFLGGVGLMTWISAHHGELAPLVRALLASGAVGGAALGLAVLAAPGLGGGDVTLFGAVGLYLGWIGWEQVVLGVLLSFVLAASAAVLLLIARRISVGGEFAFGPAIICGALVVLVLP